MARYLILFCRDICLSVEIRILIISVEQALSLFGEEL